MLYTEKKNTSLEQDGIQVLYKNQEDGTDDVAGPHSKDSFKEGNDGSQSELY